MNFIINKENLPQQTAEIARMLLSETNQDKAMMVEVRRYNRSKEISLAQMAYLHCEDGPIATYAREHGYSKLESELILKRECGEHLFIHYLTNDNLSEKINGRTVYLYYECSQTFCKRLILPERITYKDGVRCCNYCQTKQPKLVAIYSKTELNTRQTTEWIDNMYNWLRDMHNIQVEMPNKEWRL